MLNDETYGFPSQSRSLGGSSFYAIPERHQSPFSNHLSAANCQKNQLYLTNHAPCNNQLNCVHHHTNPQVID